MSLNPVDVTPTVGGVRGGVEIHCWRGSVLFPTGSHPQGKQNPFPLRQTLPHITVTLQVIWEPGGPRLRLQATSSLFPQRPHTFQSFFHNRGHQKTELSGETGGFLVASGISVRLPKEHFTKRQVTW